MSLITKVAPNSDVLLESVFDIFDTDTSNSLDKDEFVNMLTAMVT